MFIIPKKTTTNYWILLFLAFFVLSPYAALAALTPSDTANKQYRQAYAYYNNLVSDTSKAKNRKNWLTGVQLFRKIYQASPENDIAPSCLFMLGRIYHDMYRWSNNPLDLGESIAYYEDVATLFSKHRLADDALYAIGKIFLTDKKSTDEASRIFAKIVAIYPDSDMAQTAESQLKQIKGKDFSVTSSSLSGQSIQNNPKTAPNPKKVRLLPIRYWSSKDYTRVVIETTGAVTYKEHILKKSASLPRRLFLDLYSCQAPQELQTAIPIADGLLKQVRSAQYTPEDTRVVLDIHSISDYKIFSLKDPYRVVIDVIGEKKPAPGKTAALSKQFVPSLPQQLGLDVKRIVIDPGHGGKDTGAIGPNGLKEKNVVLKIAKKLAHILQSSYGYEVVMTRDRDKFIPLEERTAIANSSNADLFVSIHANAAPKQNVRGIETYYLDLTDNVESMQVAARENASTTSHLSDLQAILLDLIQNTKLNESAKLAELIQGNLVSGLGRKYKGINNLGVKQAPFIVLIGAQMPAILSEIAFISNPQEEKMLNNEKFLADVVGHLANSISQYAAELNLAQLKLTQTR